MTKWFARFARDEEISDERLCDAIARAEQGSVDAHLGGDLIKQRVARRGGGRSGGYRTLIAYRAAQRSVFLYGFAKSERDNINPRKLAELKTLARRFMSLTNAELVRLLAANEMRELDYHDPEED